MKSSKDQVLLIPVLVVRKGLAYVGISLFYYVPV